MPTEIRDLQVERFLEPVAKLLFESFRGRTASFPDMPTAREEVLASLEDSKISRIALDVSDASEQVIGWIGGMPQYDGRVWELHPLVVAEAHRGRGVGRALVADLEHHVVARGALTLWVGSDDEIDETTLSGIDLYADVPRHIRDIRNRGNHPLEFYRRIGFKVVGLLPDANGRGKPDIFFAKSVGPNPL